MKGKRPRILCNLPIQPVSLCCAKCHQSSLRNEECMVGSTSRSSFLKWMGTKLKEYPLRSEGCKTTLGRSRNEGLRKTCKRGQSLRISKIGKRWRRQVVSGE